MTTSPKNSTSAPGMRAPLRLQLRDASASGQIDGAWWPQPPDLQIEAADLIGNFPAAAGRIIRLLCSRPDWDNAVFNGRGIHSVEARRGRVKVGSFPSDDTQLMILTMATGRRLRLLMVPHDTEPAEAGRRMLDAALSRDSNSADWARWDDEVPDS